MVLCAICKATCGRNVLDITLCGGRNRRPSQHDLVARYPQSCRGWRVRRLPSSGDRVLVPAITPDWNSLSSGWLPMHSAGAACWLEVLQLQGRRLLRVLPRKRRDGNLAHMPEGMDPTPAILTWFQPASTQLSFRAGVESSATPSWLLALDLSASASVAGAALHGASHYRCWYPSSLR